MKNTVVNIGSFHIAPTQPIAVIARKIKHKNVPKKRHFPLPLITSLKPPLGGLPLKIIQPLATRAEAWQAIPGVSNWVLGIIKQGYTLQTRLYTSEVIVSILVQRSNAHILCAEVRSFLAKGAVEAVSPAQSDSGFYSRYLLGPKKDGSI